MTSFIYMAGTCLCCLILSSAHATDYTRQAESILKDSMAQAEVYKGEAEGLIESTKNQKESSFFGFDERTSEVKDAPELQPGKTCHTKKMESKNTPKARYQGDKGLYIFVSLSLEDETLKALSAQAKKVGGNLVIQGLVNNSFKETQQRLMGLGIPIDIDPTLFERFEVKRVPTFVLSEVINGEIKGPYDKVTGNVSLDAALELFAVEGEHSERAQGLLSKSQETVL